MLGVVRALPSAFDAPSSNLHLTWKPTGDDDKGLHSKTGAVQDMFSTSFRACHVRRGRFRRRGGGTATPEGGAERRSGLQTWHDDGLMAGVESRMSKSLSSNPEPGPTTLWLTSVFAVLPPATLDF